VVGVSVRSSAEVVMIEILEKECATHTRVSRRGCSG
jgi:hypothetical protein